MIRSFISLAVLISLLCQLSCTRAKVITSDQLGLNRDYCAPIIRADEETSASRLDQPETAYEKAQLFNQYFTIHDYFMARATGTLSLINDGLAQQADSSIEARLLRIEIKDQIQQQLLLFRTEIDGLVAELDCQGERLDQLSDYLADLNDRRETNLTVASVIVGAVTTVIAALVVPTPTEDIIAVSGGLLSAGLGAMTIKSKGKMLEFYHERNLLEDIWFPSKKSVLYPASIWYVLNNKDFSNSRTSTLAESIKKRWLEFEFNKGISPEEENLIFRKGGIYDAETLHKRATMINQLQSTIRSINQDLDGFIAKMDKQLY